MVINQRNENVMKKIIPPYIQPLQKGSIQLPTTHQEYTAQKCCFATLKTYTSSQSHAHSFGR